MVMLGVGLVFAEESIIAFGCQIGGDFGDFVGWVAEFGGETIEEWTPRISNASALTLLNFL